MVDHTYSLCIILIQYANWSYQVVPSSDPSPFTSDIMAQGAGVRFEHPRNGCLATEIGKPPTSHSKAIHMFNRTLYYLILDYFGSCTWPIHKPTLPTLCQLVHSWVDETVPLPATKSRQVLDEEVGGLGAGGRYNKVYTHPTVRNRNLMDPQNE